MQEDFHYCSIKCLASRAGFPDEEAEVIAYASQYVDDATEHKGITIEDVPEVARKMVVGDKFEPVCTAHRRIDYYLMPLSTKAKQRQFQRKIYIPFHFLPPAPYQGEETYVFRVKPDSPWARSLVTDAIGTLREVGNDLERLQALVRIGVRLHTYADTWSHQRFSGRRSGYDNDIERLQVNENSNWTYYRFFALRPLKNLMVPDIGHAEAEMLPDQSHLLWRYEHDKSGIVYTVQNTERFLEASESIYELLCGATGSRTKWKAIVSDVRFCLTQPTDSLKDKYQAWNSRFLNVAFDYDRKLWREQSIEGDHHDWDDFDDAEEFGKLHYIARSEDPGDLKWFLFHLAAKEQREMVLEKIADDQL